MSTSGIEDLEIMSEYDWPLRWIAPIENEQYDYDKNPFDLDREYEESGTDGTKMLSLHDEIVIYKNDEDLFTCEDGPVWHESHVWCKKVDFNFPGLLPIYKKEQIQGFENLVNHLSGKFSTVDLSEGASVVVNCKLNQDNLEEVISWDEWYGEIIKIDLSTGMVTVKDEDTEEELLTNIADLFAN
jgi:hypothetical protein